MLKILELCCGTGRLTLPIARDGYDISGVDYTSSMLDQAKIKVSEATLDISFSNDIQIYTKEYFFKYF